MARGKRRDPSSLGRVENDTVAGQVRPEQFNLEHEEADLPVAAGRPSFVEQHQQDSQPAGEYQNSYPLFTQ